MKAATDVNPTIYIMSLFLAYSYRTIALSQVIWSIYRAYDAFRGHMEHLEVIRCICQFLVHICVL